MIEVQTFSIKEAGEAQLLLSNVEGIVKVVDRVGLLQLVIADQVRSGKYNFHG